MADYTLSVDGRFNDGISGRLQSIRSHLSSFAGGLQNAGQSAVSFGTLLKANVIGNVVTGGLKAVASGVQAIAGNMKSLAGELQSTSAAWSTFEGNMKMNGHMSSEIEATKKELQEFAEQTVYSASDMAQTYAQLDAVGIEGVTDLVKGFGGLAAAAENPQQAMKTLSTQATQMAAKPQVAWSDFKLMLEQTPAGIAAIAKEMGMSTSEMVAAVQDGSVATEDFFNAIKKVGTNDEFSEMATKAKTVSQAMDGLKEAVQNKLLPQFEELQAVGIDAVDAIADGFSSGGFGGAIDAVTNKVGEMLDNLDASAGISSFMNSINGGIQKVMTGMNKNMPKFIKAGGEIVNGIVVGVAQNLPVFLDGIGTLATSILETFENNAPGLMNTGKQIIDTIVSSITENLPTLLETGARLISDFYTSIGEAIPQFASTAMTILQQLIDGFTQNLPMLIDGALTIINGLVEGFTANIDQFIAGVLQLVDGVIQGIEQAAPTLLQGALQIITSLVEGITNNLPTLVSMGIEMLDNLINGIIDHIDEIIDTAVTIVNTLENSLMDNLPAILEGAGKIITSLVTGLIEHLPEVIEGATDIMINLAEGMIDHLPEILETGIKVIGELVVGLIEAIPKIIEAIPKIFEKMVNAFMEQDWLQIGKDIIGGIADGIVDAGGAIWESLKSTVGGAVDKVKSFFGIASPSKLMRDEVGQYISEGVGVGILKGMPSMLEDVRQMNNQLYKSVDGITSSASTAGYGTSNTTYGNTYGDVSMNIYGAEGQSEERLAMIIRNRLIREYQEEGMVYA